MLELAELVVLAEPVHTPEQPAKQDPALLEVTEVHQETLVAMPRDKLQP